MTALDYVFIAILVTSMIVGAFRGLIKEAVSVGSLIIAVWAAFRFAPAGQGLLGAWLESPALQVWVARIAIFVLVLMLGGLAGWLISRFANQVGMSGLDRTLGLVFGFLRGAIICGLIVIVGPYLELDEDGWWQRSRLLPYASRVAETISIVAPRAFDYLRDEMRNSGDDDAAATPAPQPVI